MMADCWFRDKGVNIAEEKEVSFLFMAHYDINKVTENAWLVDSGCFNHMTGRKEMFTELDKTKKMNVKLGDDREIKVEGKGVVALKTSSGHIKHIQEVQYVPHLAHNLLSVGQLLTSGHSIIFDNDMCVIKDKETGLQLACVHMTLNKMFPLDVNNVEVLNMVSDAASNSLQWHLRYGHLNLKGMKLLTQKTYGEWSASC